MLCKKLGHYKHLKGEQKYDYVLITRKLQRLGAQLPGLQLDLRFRDEVANESEIRGRAGALVCWLLRR